MDKRNLRYNILTVLVYIIGIILIIQLFNLQIVHGEEYREKSSTRLTRETKIEAARGNILDRNGNTIAGTITQYSLEIYKSKIDKQTLNNTLLEVTKVLDQHNDSYKDKFPIDAETLAFTMDSQEEINNWLKSNKLEENLTSEQVINKFKEKYEIKNEDIKEARKIIGLRYGIEKEGYSSMSAYVISNNISKESVAIFEEQSSKFPGIATSTTPRRKYLRGNLASHILGYIGPINKEELDEHEGYSINDYIGKTGIEFLFEKYLKGENGKKQTDMTIDGVTSAEYITKEAVAGDDVVLTIDANLQSVAESALKNNGLEVRQELIWNKNALVLGTQDYQWKHEPCLYGWKPGASHYFIDDRTQTTVIDNMKIDYNKMKKEELVELVENVINNLNTTVINENKPTINDLHPTMKPISLIGRQIKNSSRLNEIVLDLFGRKWVNTYCSRAN